jgi:hypothetical protein
MSEMKEEISKERNPENNQFKMNSTIFQSKKLN